jgi:hypothetical protein
MDPINYMLDVKNPIEEAIKGYTMGRNEIAQRQDMQIQQQNAARQQPWLMHRLVRLNWRGWQA